MRINQMLSFQEFSNMDNFNTGNGVTVRTTLPWKSEKIHIFKDNILIYDSSIESNPSTEKLRNLLVEYDNTSLPPYDTEIEEEEMVVLF